MASAASILSQFTSFIDGFRLPDGADLKRLVTYLFAAQSGVTALAGGGRAGSPILALGYNQIDTVASGSDSVQLPPANPGAVVTVFNNGAQTLAIFGGYDPASAATDTIVDHSSTGAGGASVTLASGYVGELICFKAGIWKLLLSA